MSKYHKIIINGEVRYRAFNEGTGFYGNGTISEAELIEQLLVEVVEEVIEIDKGQIERAISYLPEQYQREMIQNYIDYLERLAELLEQAHDISS
ncbi:hypothetical protein [Metabacillus fastidiosus]|uniref:hypothetical protein n=1 Tax=Metabacillus fastidiosus TaxID=1458 RepID=UPI000825F970|nr:hypothetical protein [Metabacillus fastidiosus]MED4464484.1 hypothetical protein [Metabacillus fastidiosus]